MSVGERVRQGATSCRIFFLTSERAVIDFASTEGTERRPENKPPDVQEAELPNSKTIAQARWECLSY